MGRRAPDLLSLATCARSIGSIGSSRSLASRSPATISRCARPQPRTSRASRPRPRSSPTSAEGERERTGGCDDPAHARCAPRPGRAPARPPRPRRHDVHPHVRVVGCTRRRARRRPRRGRCPTRRAGAPPDHQPARGRAGRRLRGGATCRRDRGTPQHPLDSPRGARLRDARRGALGDHRRAGPGERARGRAGVARGRNARRPDRAARPDRAVERTGTPTSSRPRARPAPRRGWSPLTRRSR